MDNIKDKGHLGDDIFKKAQQINKKNKSIIAQRNVEDKGTAILVKDLDLWYGDFKALKKINMDIKKGKVTAFIGPSGCGKSTTLKCFNRMNDLIDSCKIEGLIEIEGADIYKKDVDVVSLRRNVGMVFQAPNPFSKSVYDNITYGPKLSGIKDKDTLDGIVENSLKAAAIWDEVKDKLDQNALSFSGGQQQRICIARTLSVNPEIILMDEPTSALDPISTSAIEDLMDQLKEKYTIVIVTHNMQQAARISDETAFFLTGEVIEMDQTKKIFEDPADKRTEDYITGRFG
ncbi:phosphate ABC transporter ATP-binding protein PstB [uncultured Anaerococcus sp.]|uniref:phosphate ABC transporter ATP-binding protein PstB n=1 Tax=uncultured Anaerococcus sp. TaxID=293428 RepID=UPI002889080F|nr:phosphate ABC transporter ATP-binding protein PstB [uncultured Anaerococcus sp.]